MELWQLYDEQGLPLPGQGATKDEIRKGLLHGASHVWIWRKSDHGIEVLLQKRADDKPTWPDLYDISAAGHIDLGETPLEAAARETIEEIGFNISAADMQFIGVYRSMMVTDSGIIENELQWIYLTELKGGVEFQLEGKLLDKIEHPNKLRYGSQQVLIVEVDDYAYLVPFVEDDDKIFLKTIIPSRKATKKYLRGEKS